VAANMFDRFMEDRVIKVGLKKQAELNAGGKGEPKGEGGEALV